MNEFTPLGECGPEARLGDRLDTLEKRRLDCEREGRYEEAEIARASLEQSRQLQKRNRLKKLHSRQLSSRDKLDKVFMLELEEFNDMMDTKAEDLEMECAHKQQHLFQKHKKYHEALLYSLSEKKERMTPKWSRDLRNMRKIQHTLARQKNYAEAEKAKIEADRIMEQEFFLWNQKQENKIAGLRWQFERRQELERADLLKRLLSKRKELEQDRECELERLIQEYHNVKTRLISQQKINQQRVEKDPFTMAANW